MYPSIPHRVEIPNDHPGTSEDPERRLITIVYRRPTKEKSEIQEDEPICEYTDLRVETTVSDSVPLALFLFRNGHYMCGIVDYTDHGLLNTMDWEDAAQEQRNEYEISPPWGNNSTSSSQESLTQFS